MSFFYMAGYSKDMKRVTPLMINDDDRNNDIVLEKNIDVYYKRYLHIYTFKGKYTIRVLLQELLGGKNISIHDIRLIKKDEISNIKELNGMTRYVNSGLYEIDDIITSILDCKSYEIIQNELWSCEN